MAEQTATDTGQDTGGLLARWRQTEPVRLWLYGMLAPLLALLVAYGVVAESRRALWLAVGAALFTGGGAELARGDAWAPASVRRALQQVVTTRTPDEVAAWLEQQHQDDDEAEHEARPSASDLVDGYWAEHRPDLT